MGEELMCVKRCDVGMMEILAIAAKLGARNLTQWMGKVTLADMNKGTCKEDQP